MEPAEIVIMIFGTIMLLISLINGIYLLWRITKTKLLHIAWLSAFFLITVIEFIFRMAYAAEHETGIVGGFTVVYYSINIVSYLFLIIFVKNTFYLHRKSPFLVLIGTTIIAKIIYTISSIMYTIEFNLQLRHVSMGCSTYIIAFSSLWLVYSSLSFYWSIKNKEIQDWIKKRYLIVGIAAIFLAAQSIPTALTPYQATLEDPFLAVLSIVHVILNVIFAILNSIAWIMPKRVKQYLNRGSQLKEEKEFTEKELLEIISQQLSNGGANGDN